MSYSPYDRKPSGIVFFGDSSSDQLYESVDTLVYNSGTSTLLSTNFTASSLVSANSYIIADNGTIGTSGTNNAITVGADGSISILGDLTVNGTTTTVNSTTITVEDPIIILGSGTPTSDDNKDRGVSFNYHDGIDPKTGFFGFDDSTGKFTFIPEATIIGEVVSGSSGILVADLEGNADTATALETSRYIGVSDQVTGSGLFNGTSDLIFNVQLTADAINDQSTATTANNDDFLLIASGTALRKISKSNFVTDLGGGTMSNFTVSADGGTDQIIENGNTLELAGGSGILTTGSATDTITFDINVDNTTLEISSDVLQIKASGVTESQRSRTIETITSNTANDYGYKDITIIDASSNNVTVTLPSSTSAGKIMAFKRKDNSSNSVIIQRNGTDTIDASNSFQLYHRFETITIVSDGGSPTSWYII